ncbi:choice-of-anchor P family protein [Ktedonobacter racemifer]|nr:choice-of-anchor P family protein [Ktedonobacter racemifer]
MSQEVSAMATTGIEAAVDPTVIVTAVDLDYTSSNPADVAGDGLKKWFMYNDTVDNTLGSFVVEPGIPPPGNGRGSVQFTLGPSLLPPPQLTQRDNIATYQFSGTRLVSITAMSYSAYSHSGVAGPNESPFLNFNVDFDGNRADFQGRLVYVPSANGAVQQDTWNTFDVIGDCSPLWTWSRLGSHGNKWPDYPLHQPQSTSQYRTWHDIITAFPDARILPISPDNAGWLGIRVGEPGPTGYTGNVGSFTLGTAAGTTTFDFEPTAIVQARAFGLQSTNPAAGPFGNVSIQCSGSSQSLTVPSAFASGIIAVGITDTVSSPPASTSVPPSVDASSVINQLSGHGIVAIGMNVQAHATGSSLSPSGSTSFAMLIVPGQPVRTNYSPSPNTQFTLPNGDTLMLNEQVVVQQTVRTSMQTNGLHLHTAGGTDVLAGHVEATITYV